MTTAHWTLALAGAYALATAVVLWCLASADAGRPLGPFVWFRGGALEGPGMEEGAQCPCSFGARRTARAFPESWGLGQGWQLQPAHPRPRAHANRATVVHSTYSSPDSVRALLRNAATWPADLGARVDLLLADDAGSPRAVDVVMEELRTLRLPCAVGIITLHRDVGFNNGGARNTACMASRTETVCLLDQDFGLRPRHLRQLLEGVPAVASSPATVWTVRKSVKGPEQWPNLFVVHARGFLARGGYDERLSGTYGLEDVLLRKRSHHGHFVVEEHPSLVFETSEWGRTAADDNCPSCADLGQAEKQRQIESQRERIEGMDGPARLHGSPPVRVEWDIDWVGVTGALT